MSTRPQRGIIVAVSPEWAIGIDGRLPWHHPGDLRRFARVTAGSTVIMGRKTWESIPEKLRPLKGRYNIVLSASLSVTRGPDLVAGSVQTALEWADHKKPIWFIGGARVYAEALAHVDIIDVTFVPDRVERTPTTVYFAPPINDWVEGRRVQHEDEPTLTRAVFTRRPAQ